MSLLIGDVGGSSSRWALLSGEPPSLFEGLPGFNPAVGEPAAFISALREKFAADGVDVDRVIVYGAGCGSEARKQRMREAMEAVFGARSPSITIESDLLGAARGLCGTSPGLVLILGTGMNAGHFTGEQFDRLLPSRGYVLGDEGSGADIGKCLVRDALRSGMPQKIRDVLFPDGITLEEVIEHTYRSASPQAWLASFTSRLSDLRQELYVAALLKERFTLLAGQVAATFPEDQRVEVFAAGSVAWSFQEILRDSLMREGMRLVTAERDPLAGLVRFHRQQR